LLGTVGYNTSFIHGHKLREGLVRGHNTGFLSGIIEMDGAHASGRDAGGKRGKPLGGFRKTEDEEKSEAQSIIDAVNAKQTKARHTAAPGEPKPVRDPDFGNTYPEDRRIVVTIRRRAGNPGKGALSTRVGVGFAETPDVIQALADRHVMMPESVLSTDSAGGYNKVGRQFKLHVTVNHSEALVGPEGQNNNQAEGFTARQDRAEAGVYLNIEPKYLMDYVVETAFREDHRRVAPGRQADRALHFALNIGRSQYWTNFTHGRHRDFEILRPENRPAKASGPAKGRSPVAAQNGRAPR
ncbi:MAG: transposase, partial [Burkholderiales bacterium]|nr:transposase [Burkholderiales bacterium]